MTSTTGPFGPPPKVAPLVPGDPAELGGYELLGRLGSGGMGTVYLARMRSGRLLAVKAVLAEHARTPDFRTRFRREIEAAARVRSPFTAALVDADPDAPRPWMATEHVPGPTLAQAVTDRGPLPSTAVRSLVAGVAEALVAIHRAGLVHRDLKPSNVILAPDGPRVIDLGVARTLDATGLTTTGLQIGTPHFMAPEQARGVGVTPAADVWALGLLAYVAATGLRPFGDGTPSAILYRVVHEQPDLGACPDWLRPLVAACLAKDPAARPSPAAVASAVGQPGSLPLGAVAAPAAPFARVTAPGADDDRTSLRAPLPVPLHTPVPDPFTSMATATHLAAPVTLPDGSARGGHGAPPPRKPRRALLVGIAAVLVAGLGTAAAFAFQPDDERETPPVASPSASPTLPSPSPEPPAPSPSPSPEPSPSVEPPTPSPESAPVQVEPPPPALFTIGTVGIAGSPVFGQDLTATADGWVPAPEATTCVWFRGTTRLATDGGCTYRVQQSDVGQQLKVELTATAAGHEPGSAMSGHTAEVVKATLAVDTPQATGTLRVGQRLTCKVNSIPGASYAYRFYHGDGAGDPTEFAKTGRPLTQHYATIPSAAEGFKVRCNVTVTKPGYTTVDKSSAAVGPIKPK
ncbi:protein kinase domain-containing protein [Antribacter gilvus]|uniref:serine/threonine-protein kinase n=1 Tax=Antribacter gilvus TaxID=2304675 RepID=UPI000F78EDAA|nr:protein kinase [Antribacter gilvus]